MIQQEKTGLAPALAPQLNDEPQSTYDAGLAARPTPMMEQYI